MRLYPKGSRNNKVDKSAGGTGLSTRFENVVPVWMSLVLANGTLYHSERMVRHGDHGAGGGNACQILPRDQRIHIEQGEQILEERAAAAMGQGGPAQVYVWHGFSVRRA